MPYFHLVAKARAGCKPLRAPRNAWLLWARLRREFPAVIAACLMPDHVHLVVNGDSPEIARRKLALAVRGFSRAAGTRGLWDPLPSPAGIPDRRHLQRHIRYVHLNPCRDGLSPDPLCWPWSTHRALCGAEYDPWSSPRLLARELGKPQTAFVDWLHGYVSADPSVAVAGTPPPGVAACHTLPLASPTDIRDAVLAAAPLASRATLRAGFVALSGAQGFCDYALLSRLLGITYQHTLFLSKKRDDALLHAASVCLGDARLRHHAAATPRAAIFSF